MSLRELVPILKPQKLEPLLAKDLDLVFYSIFLERLI